jgi:hypothetical protein
MNCLFIVILLFGVICGTSAQTRIPPVANIYAVTDGLVPHYYYLSFVKESSNSYSLISTELEVISNQDDNFKFKTVANSHMNNEYLLLGTVDDYSEVRSEYEFELSGNFSFEESTVNYDGSRPLFIISIGPAGFFTLSNDQEMKQQYVNVDTIMSQKLQKILDRRPKCSKGQQTPIKAVAITMDNIPDLSTDASPDECHKLLHSNIISGITSHMTMLATGK